MNAYAALLVASIFLHTGGAQLITPHSCNLNLVLDNNNTCVNKTEVKSVIQSEVQHVQTQVQSLQNEVQSIKTQVQTFHNEVRSSHTTAQTSFNAEVQSLRNDVDSLTENVAEIQKHTLLLMQSLLPGTYTHPAASCRYIRPGSPSRNYWIQTNTNFPTSQYCDMTRTSCCNTTGGWMRVANLDMNDTNQQCPLGFRLVTSPRRTCGRPGSGCVSTTFPVHGVEYSRVCGKVKAYQFGHTDSFDSGTNDIDSHYAEGVSLTHGSPRLHIWTFAAGRDETRNDNSRCPCSRTDLPYTETIPSFVGQDYFCDSGTSTYNGTVFYQDDPLWDGQGCGPTSTCCSFNNPPWFCKQLLQPTRDDIELRLCASVEPSEDTPIEAVEIYIQ